MSKLLEDEVTMMNRKVTEAIKKYYKPQIPLYKGSPLFIIDHLNLIKL